MEHDPLELLTVRQASELTKLSRTSLYREIEDGKLQALRIRGSVRIQRSELERYVRAAATT